MEEISISVTNLADQRSLRPVTGGVPIRKGAAPSGSRFFLKDTRGEPVLCQSEVPAKWPDGSARWVLLDFQSEPPANGKATYALSWGDQRPGVSHEVPVESRGGGNFLLKSGNVALGPAKDALLDISGRARIAFRAVDDKGKQYFASPESVELQTRGDLRSAICIKGAFRDGSGERWFGFRLWASVYAGLSRVLIEPMVLMDAENGLIQRIRELKLEIAPVGGVKAAVLGGEPGWRSDKTPNARLFQIDDQDYTVEGAKGKGSRAPGWAEIDGGKGNVAVALRDFWQQWPKSLEVSPERLAIGLLPRFADGAFAHMQPWYKHDYLFEGDCYRLRTGQVRRWQIWLDLEGNGESLSRHANAPLMPAADPAQAIATGAWGDVMPAGAPGMADYDRWVDALFKAYCGAIEKDRDYGAMNWGDWWGERGCNWGNHEYDTPRQLLIQFARTADPRYFHVGNTAARHMSEVDVVHFVNSDLVKWFDEVGKVPGYPPRPGMVHEHAVGHVGGFHSVQTIRELYVKLRVGATDRPYLCLDPYNLGHIFTEGMAQNYFLTGDPWMRETLDKIGDSLAKLVEDREFAFKGHNHCGRVNGWSMLALAGIYEVDPSERYLSAMKTLADDALSEQDPHCGGWLYQLGPGHCNCVTRKHVGEAGFIGSIRLNGLYRYYQLTGDKRIPEAIKKGITHINNDTWREADSGWRYTSCPASSSSRQPGVTIQSLASAVRIADDPEHLRILRKAWAALFERLKASPASAGAGKTFSSTLYGCPETISLLATRPES